MVFRRGRQGFHEQGMKNVSKQRKKHGKNSNVRSSKGRRSEGGKKRASGWGKEGGKRSEAGNVNSNLW